jgi:hypothetical protein
MPYKTVMTLDSDTNSFVDESAINGMAYTYKVIAADNAGNVSNPSNEAGIGTVTAERPLAPASVPAKPLYGKAGIRWTKSRNCLSKTSLVMTIGLRQWANYWICLKFM